MNSIKATLLPATLLFSLALQAQPTLVVNHYQKHSRYEFGLQVLNLALSKLNTPYQLKTPKGPQLNEARGEILVTAGKLDLQWMSTSKLREQKMIAIKIPIYQGILGLRLLLTTHEKYPAISQIKTLEQLQQFVGGHGTHWQDLPVYAANNLPVSTYINYDSLFRQLANNRFDYFHRGLNEIWKEQEAHFPTFKIAKNVMLLYPHPVYFFVSTHKPELAEHIEAGLNIALQDGSFKHLFLSEHQELIEKSDLENRHLIRLKNPVAPSDSSNFLTQWWLPEKSN